MAHPAVQAPRHFGFFESPQYENRQHYAVRIMNSDHAKTLIDAGAAGTMIATIAGWLPDAAAVLTIIWTIIRIAESKTAERFIAWVRRK